jgi:hypothetical protein
MPVYKISGSSHCMNLRPSYHTSQQSGRFNYDTTAGTADASLIALDTILILRR